jgi:hypothetical protein
VQVALHSGEGDGKDRRTQERGQERRVDDRDV